MVAPRALVFRPLVKGNEDSGNEIDSYPIRFLRSDRNSVNRGLLVLRPGQKCKRPGWTSLEVAILGADQKERVPWEENHQ